MSLELIKLHDYTNNIIQVIWGRLYNTKSTREMGTMYQLRNLIGRNVVPSDPEKNMNDAEDFMLLLVNTHVVQAARVLQLDNPVSSVTALAGTIVDKFVHLSHLSSTNTPESVDDVLLYVTELLSLGLLWHSFHDAVKEADGDRILRSWKFLLILFKSIPGDIKAPTFHVTCSQSKAEECNPWNGS